MTEYLAVSEEGALPQSPLRGWFKCVVIIDAPISLPRQMEISRWLVESGCLYMMAWGPDCSAWDDSVDFANMERFNFEEIPEHASVMTTWHEEDTMEEVFHFALNHAKHPIVDLQNTLILHITTNERREELIRRFESVCGVSAPV